MSWTDGEIDKLFAENTAKQVPFREEYWTEVEAMLPPEPVRKPFPWIALTGCFLVAAALVTLFALIRHTAPAEELAGARLARQGFPAFALKDVPAETEEATSEASAGIQQHPVFARPTIGSSMQHASGTGLPAKTYEPGQLSTSATDDPATAFGSGLQNFPGFTTEPANPFVASHDSELLALKTESERSMDSPKKARLFAIGDLQAREALIPASTAPAPAPILPAIRPRVHFYADLGAGLGSSLISNGDNLTKSISLSAGADFPIGNRAAFSVGGGFTTINYNNLEINESTVHYGFGKVNYRNKFRYKALYLAQTPLQLTFFAKRSAFQLLLTPGYLIQTKMKYTYYENDQEVERTVIYGETHGLDRFSLQAGLGYRYLLTANFEIGVRCQSELLQNVSKKGSTVSANSLPFQAQLFLRKKLAF